MKDKRLDEKIEHYNKARQIMEAFLPLVHPSLAKVWISMANVRLHEGAYDDSITICKEPSEIQKLRGEDHRDIILTYNSLGVVYRLKKQYPTA